MVFAATHKALGLKLDKISVDIKFCISFALASSLVNVGTNDFWSDQLKCIFPVAYQDKVHIYLDAWFLASEFPF